MEAVDDVAVGDIHDRGSCFKETMGVRFRSFPVCLHWARSWRVPSRCREPGKLSNVVFKSSKESMELVDGVGRETFKPSEWGMFQSHRKVDYLRIVGATYDFNYSE